MVPRATVTTVVSSPDHEAPTSADVGLRRAITWLRSSGIQADAGGACEGSFYAWYDCARATYAFAYPEATGYGLSLWTVLARTGFAPAALARASAAADWLLWACREGSPPARIHPQSGQPLVEYTYTFDAGMIVAGLARLGALAPDDRREALGRSLCRWLIHTMQMPNGSFRARARAVSGRPVEAHPRWSGRPGGYHANIAAAVALFGRQYNDPNLVDAGIRAGNWVVAQQASNGAFVDAGGRTLLHPQAYACEGLLCLAAVVADRHASLTREYEHAATRGLLWMLHLADENGDLPAAVQEQTPVPDEPHRTDILSQLLRLVFLSIESGRLDPAVAQPTVNRVVGRLLQAQVRSDDLAADGGFIFNPRPHAASHVNSWVTMFATQTLLWFAGHVRPCALDLV